MRSVDACGTLLSRALDRAVDPSGQTSKSAPIVLIDRRPLICQCISRWLQDGSPDRYVVWIGSPVDLLNASLNNPHVIILSIGAASVADPDVLGKITLLRRHMSPIPLVLLSDRDDLDDIAEAMEQGVRGYITTSLKPSEAAAALQYVAAGGTFVPASAMIKSAQDRKNGSRPEGDRDSSPLRCLTPRESEVLARLCQGKPNKIIAHELEISENTVKVFVRQILTKLHASNRTELACFMRDRVDSPGGS
jgi:DNA-binding NarL/FixJ family response regulator